MKGQRQLHPSERKRVAAAVLLAMGLIHSLLLQPFAHFVIADDGGPGALGDRNCIAQMIAVTVRDEQKMGLDVVRLGSRGRIAGQEGVGDELLAIALDPQAGMAQPLDARGHGWHSRWQDWVRAYPNKGDTLALCDFRSPVPLLG